MSLHEQVIKSTQDLTLIFCFFYIKDLKFEKAAPVPLLPPIM